MTLKILRGTMATFLLLPVLVACAAAGPSSTPTPIPATPERAAPSQTPLPPEPTRTQAPSAVPVPPTPTVENRIVAPTVAVSEPGDAPTATPTAVVAIQPVTTVALGVTPAPRVTPVAVVATPGAVSPGPTVPPVAGAIPTAISTLVGVNVPPSSFPVSSIPVTVNIDSTFPRNGPDWNAGPVGRMLKWSVYPAIGRDATAAWVLVQDGTSRQWLHGSMIRYETDLTRLPVSAQGFSPGVLAPARIAAGLPSVSGRARQLYAQAVAAGRDAGIVTVVGDCNSEWQVYLGRFANGGFSLGASGAGYLQPVVNLFSRSFYRASLATHGSFSAGAALDPIWSDPRQCQAGENPLACELRVSKASVVIIALGTGDQFTWQSFETSLRGIIELAIVAKTVPILMTKADDLDSQQGGAPPGYLNDVMRRLGAQFDIPVIDLWRATRDLPQNGLAREVREDPARGIVDQGVQRFHLSDDGMNARILLTLQTLSALAR